MRRKLLAAALAFPLAACASGDRIMMERPAGYISLASIRTAGVPWARARAIPLMLSEYKFAPESLTFKVGVPYRLILRNTGGSDHTFVSEAFFKAIAVRKFSDPDASHEYPYVQRIQIESGQQKELLFLPMRQGTYRLHCSVTLHESFGMAGTITVR